MAVTARLMDLLSLHCLPDILLPHLSIDGGIRAMSGDLLLHREGTGQICLADPPESLPLHKVYPPVCASIGSQGDVTEIRDQLVSASGKELPAYIKIISVSDVLLPRRVLSGRRCAEEAVDL